MDKVIFIGVSAPGIQPDRMGLTAGDAASSGMWSDGGVWTARKVISSELLPDTAIIAADLFKQRPSVDRVYSNDDEVLVTVDYASDSLQIQTPTVSHVIALTKTSASQGWVLNVCFGKGEHQMQLCP